MTRQPVSHRGCWHKINGKATNTGIKLHSPRTGNPFPGKASPQTAPEATITASVTDYQPWHLPTAPPAAPTPCCIPRYRSVGSTFPLIIFVTHHTKPLSHLHRIIRNRHTLQMQTTGLFLCRVKPGTSQQDFFSDSHLVMFKPRWLSVIAPLKC